MHKKMHTYGPLAKHQLEPLFAKANVHYPGKKLTLLVFKKSHRLQLWASEDNHWRYIKTYPILAASGHLGPKLLAGDRQVPEGIYKIHAFNPNSRFTLSMQLNYPNQFDRMQAEREGRTNLGKDIFIHGKDSSVGCLAIGDEAIEELFVLSRLVGKHHIDVIIAPQDFHDSRFVVAKQGPSWTGSLYEKIKAAMHPFRRPHLVQTLRPAKRRADNPTRRA
jgi:hypothetical protein